MKKKLKKFYKKQLKKPVMKVVKNIKKTNPYIIQSNCYNSLSEGGYFIWKHIKAIFFIYILWSWYSTPISHTANNLGSNEVDTARENTNIISSIFSADFFINIIFAVVVILASILLSKIVVSKISGFIQTRYTAENSNTEEIAAMLSRTISIIFLVVGFTTGLSIMGVDLGIFMWGIGFWLWFTLKTFLTNFVWGIMMVTQGQYHIGDLVQVQSKTGKITQINSLFTAIEQFDGVVFYIPNVIFMEEVVSNYKTNDKRRVEIDVGVDYATDIVQAKKVMLQVLDNFPNILKAPASDIFVENFAESSIHLSLRFWITSEDNYFETKSNVTETINLAFRQANITIPFPQITISNRK